MSSFDITRDPADSICDSLFCIGGLINFVSGEARLNFMFNILRNLQFYYIVFKNAKKQNNIM